MTSSFPGSVKIYTRHRFHQERGYPFGVWMPADGLQSKSSSVLYNLTFKCDPGLGGATGGWSGMQAGLNLSAGCLWSLDKQHENFRLLWKQFLLFNVAHASTVC